MKYRICVVETVEYKHSIGFESDFDEDTVDSILDEIESTSDNRDDVSEKLKQYGCNVTDYCEDDCGETDEIEIIDLEKVEDEEDWSSW